VELKTQDEAEQQCAQKRLFKIISALQFLAISKGYLALKYLANQGSKVVTKKKQWTSHDIQNEIIEIMAHFVLRSIVHDVKVNK